MAVRRASVLSLVAVLLVGSLAAAHAQGPKGERPMRPTGRGPVPSSASPDIVLAEQRGCGPGPYLSPNMQNCVIDDFMGSNGTLTVGFSVDPKAAKKHALLLTLRSVGGAAVV